ncbi:MAG: UvrD-helicase domain-containing protein [Thermoplasmata archaeon]
MNCENLTQKQMDVIRFFRDNDVSAFAVAGSGKTTVLVCAYMDIIDNLIKKYGDVSRALDDVLVVTFTDDAATEIRERIRKNLEDKYNYIGPLNFISTIHSFANKILKNVTVKLGIDPDYIAGEEYMIMDLKISTYKEIIKSMPDTEKLVEYLNPIRIGSNELSISDIIFILYEKTKVMGWDPSFTISKVKETLKDYEDEKEAMDYIINPLVKIFAKFYEELENKKKRMGLLSYDDILYYANKALNENLVENIKNFEYIIVDEYQDTSHIQQEIINKVARNSRKIYAGDFFQSIYEWRDATPQETMKNVSAGKFIPVEMNENFRSIPEIIDFINSLFSKIFKENLPSIKYINIKAIEKSLNEGGVFILKGQELNARERHKVEAEKFAIAILHLLKEGKVREKDGTIRNIEMGDIAILFRSKSYMKIYADALRKHGIKFTFVDKEGFFQTVEISILLDLLNILNEKKWKNINDYEVAEILNYAYEIPISKRNEKSTGNYLSDMETLSKLMNGRKDKIILEFLKKTEFDIKVLNDLNGIQKYLNIYRFVDLLREIENEKILSMEKFMEKLYGIIENERISSLPIFELGEKSVRLITIHASKGLEFPVVFVSDLQSQFKRNTDQMYFDRDVGIYIEIEELMNEKKTKELEEEISRRRLQENLRILYVAFTRAKQYLIFSLPDTGNEKEKSFSDFILKNFEPEKLAYYRNRAKDFLEKDIDYRPKIESGQDFMLLPVKREIKKIPYISATDIRDFIFCPRYYYLRKTFGNFLENESVRFGEIFHTFMENLDFDENDIPVAFQDYVSFIKNIEIWNEIMNPENRIFKEYEIRLKIDHTILIARYDLLSIGKNSIIVDYKTGTENYLDAIQMQIYAFAFYKKFKEIPKKEVIIYLKTKNIMEFSFNEEDLLNIEKRIKYIIFSIENENFIRNDKNCDKCSLMNICKKQN